MSNPKNQPGIISKLVTIYWVTNTNCRSQIKKKKSFCGRNLPTTEIKKEFKNQIKKKNFLTVRSFKSKVIPPSQEI